MAIIVWDESYSVNIKEFDANHKQLINLINQLFDAMRSGKGSQEILGTLDSLIIYTQFHFTSEEKTMLQHNYVGYVKHRAEHEALKKKVLEYQAQAQKGQIGISVQVANFLKEWLLTHIMVEDKRYSSFLQGKEIAKA